MLIFLLSINEDVLCIHFIMYMSFLSIASVNVNGLRNEFKRNVLFEFLKRHKYSIIFVQETHSEEGDESIWSTQWQGKTFLIMGTVNQGGCNFYFR